jgi:hypothetical protein
LDSSVGRNQRRKERRSDFVIVRFSFASSLMVRSS